MFLITRFIKAASWFLLSYDERVNTNNLYILIDCDTRLDAFIHAVETFKNNNRVFVHGYGKSQIDIPDGVKQGGNIGSIVGNEYEITTSNPEYKALFRLIEMDNMTMYYQLSHVVFMIEVSYSGASCCIVSKDDDVLELIRESNNEIERVNIYMYNDVEEMMLKR